MLVAPAFFQKCPAGGYAAAQLLPGTGRPGARSRGGCGLARPVVPGGVSLLAVLVSTRSSVVTNAASIAIITATAKSPMAVRWLSRSLLMRDLHSGVETLYGLDGSHSQHLCGTKVHLAKDSNS